MRDKVMDGTCTVMEHLEVLPGAWRTVLRPPAGMAGPRPGQFVQIEASPGLFPVTRRPFTVNRVYGGDIEVIFDVVGRGTAVLASLKPGMEARVLGPLGKGWETGTPGKWLLIGGGLGAAGFQFLLDTVQCCGVFVGASSRKRLLPLECSCRFTIATEDGSAGHRGLVTDILDEESFFSADHIALCGPVAMMNAVWNAVPSECRSRVQVSTESRMGCGWGVCEGCSIPVKDGGYRKCCTDGPVFPGESIDWKRWKEAGL